MALQKNIFILLHYFQALTVIAGVSLLNYTMMRIFITLICLTITFTLVLQTETSLAGCGGDAPFPLGATNICLGDSVVLKYVANQHCDSYGRSKRWYRNGVIIAEIPEFYQGSQLVVYESGEYSLDCNGAYIDRTPISVTVQNPIELEQPFFEEDSGLLTSSHLGFQYQWLFNGTELVDATTDTLRITAAGEYQLMLSDLLGCFSYSSSPITVTEDYLASLQPEPLVLVPILFPIPNAGNFTLMYAFPAGSAALLELLDATGRHIDSFYLEGERDQWEFSCPHLANGIYHYKVFLNGTVVKTERLVVSR